MIDISLPIREGTPRYPGKAAPRRDVLADMADGAAANCSAVYLDCHLGTHVDAPRHFVRDGITIEQVPLERLCGWCVVVDIPPPRRAIVRADLEGIEPRTRVLFRTLGSALLRAGRDDPGAFAYLTPEAAERLVELDCALIGIDAFSVDEFGTAEPAHHVLLPAGIPILECVDLSEAGPGLWELMVLPLRIDGAEAAPARAALRARSSGL